MKRYIILITAVIFAISINLFYPQIYRFANSDAMHEKKQVLLIDAGHGGIDGGAIARDGTEEKEINLAISLKLKEMAVLMGYDVLMTRETDISIHDDTAKTIREKKRSDLKNRLNLLESSPADMLVSIHQNTFGQSKYSGTQIFHGRNDKSKMYAEAVRLSIRELTQPDNNRQIKQTTNDIFLLYNAKKPAILVECGFLTNREETELLKTDEYQYKLCFAILTGLLNATS